LLRAEIRRRVVRLANGEGEWACVPLQGTGNAANEAALGSLVPRDRRLLVVDNGFYGERLVEIARAIGLDVVRLDLPVTAPARGADLVRALAAARDISHVVVCHVDTGTGLQNPIEEVAAAARASGVAVIVDAIASFGGLPLDVRALDAEAVVVSPNKWLEGVPGTGLVIARRTALEAAAGRCHSYCLDLHRQWASFERDGRWRFTPPTQVAAALAAALRQHEAEGREARLARITANWRRLVEGLRRLGFATVIPDAIAAPVIATFHEPADARYDRERFFRAMLRCGFVIFRGCLTSVPTFRIGCMGAFDQQTMERVVDAVEAAMVEMGVSDCRPAGQLATAE
jgi:2-aminoethylphosphonate-pyruvate transaminase